MDISKDIIDELIPCFQQPGYYAHIEREEIYSYKNGNWVKRKGQFNKGGYERIRLCQNGRYKWVFKHRLLFEAYHKRNITKGLIINHRDENPRNNNIKNLEECTHSYNTNYGSANKKRSEAAKGHIGYGRKPVTLTYEDGRSYFFNSGAEVCNYFQKSGNWFCTKIKRAEKRNENYIIIDNKKVTFCFS